MFSVRGEIPFTQNPPSEGEVFAGGPPKGPAGIQRGDRIKYKMKGGYRVGFVLEVSDYGQAVVSFNYKDNGETKRWFELLEDGDEDDILIE